MAHGAAQPQKRNSKTWTPPWRGTKPPARNVAARPADPYDQQRAELLAKAAEYDRAALAVADRALAAAYLRMATEARRDAATVSPEGRKAEVDRLREAARHTSDLAHARALLMRAYYIEQGRTDKR